MPSGARVLVDGIPRGETPVAIRDLPFGAHVVTVTAPGQPQWQQTVTLSPARPAQSLEVSLDGTAVAPSTTPVPAGTAAAGLQIESRPSGAQVWVDGSPAGVTPVVVPSVAAGTHSVRIELAGYQPWSTSVSVTAGQRARVAASLER
jgi:hypothetical protein